MGDQVEIDTREVEAARSFEIWLRDLSSRFIRMPAAETTTAIEDGLRAIVEFLDVDRSTLFEFSEDGSALDARHSWAREGVEPFSIPLLRDQLPWYYERLMQGHTLAYERLPDDLPPEAGREREYVTRAGMRSNLTIPILVGDTPVCALAIGSFRHQRSWPPRLVDRVRLAGEILAAALQRARDSTALLQERQKLEQTLAEVSLLKELVEAENLYLQEEIRSDHDFEEIVGESTAIHRTLAKVEMVAGTDASVLILGETGTGKELIAHAIHERSPRVGRTLVKINCAALPPTLVESELFGHEKGAFTGAVAAKRGRIELADGGSLFLDEIGDLALELQAKLLRLLEQGELERVGSTKTIRVDVRVIAATHRDLAQAVAKGTFREDLFHRLNVFPIELPALRERWEDIPLLVWHFINRRQREWGKRIEQIPRGVMSALTSYAWPGNVRELRNVVERGVILSPGRQLLLDRSFAQTASPTSAPTKPLSLDEMQRTHIMSVLEECRWRINGQGNAAERLGVHPNTLRHRMKKLQISRPR
jgi:formate hydrogenlyase transcriptional activator